MPQLPAPQPFFLYGTAWKEERTEALTQMALEAGFRGIDTANQRKHYFEVGVGSALKKAFDKGLQREELFLQSKFTYQAGQDHRLPYDPHAPFEVQVEQSFHSSLEHLYTDYLDAYLLHGPSTRPGLAEADWEVWQTLEALQDAGKTRSIGVSNVSAEQLQLLLSQARIKPAFVQNRCYAQLQWDAEVRALCQTHGIVYQGFSLLTANARELNRPQVAAMAQAHGCQITQLVFAFAHQLGMLPLTGTSQLSHMQTDLAALQLKLTPAEMQTLEMIALSGF